MIHLSTKWLIPDFCISGPLKHWFGISTDYHRLSPTPFPLLYVYIYKYIHIYVYIYDLLYILYIYIIWFIYLYLWSIYIFISGGIFLNNILHSFMILWYELQFIEKYLFIFNLSSLRTACKYQVYRNSIRFCDSKLSILLDIRTYETWNSERKKIYWTNLFVSYFLCVLVCTILNNSILWWIEVSNFILTGTTKGEIYF